MNKDVEYERSLAREISNKSNFLLATCSILFIGLLSGVVFLYFILSKLSLFITIFSSVLLIILFTIMFFASLCNFINNNSKRNILLKFSYIFLWSFLGLYLISLLVLIILNIVL